MDNEKVFWDIRSRMLQHEPMGRRISRRHETRGGNTSTPISYPLQRILTSYRCTMPGAHRIWIVLVLIGLLSAVPAYAGIPEPGITLYGKVRDGAGTLITSGTLTWKYTPDGGGNSVTLATEMEELSGPWGTFSYVTMIPLEVEVPGSPVSTGAFPLSDTPLSCTGTVQVGPTAAETTDVVEISAVSRGTIKRVDVWITYPPTDSDHDGIPDEWEIEHFGSTDASSPHVDSDGDGFTDLEEQEAGTNPHNANDAPVASYTIDGFVILQGRPTRPDPSWSVDLAFSLTAIGETVPVLDTIVTMNDNGLFTIPGVHIGTYEARIKHSHTLQIMSVITIPGDEKNASFGTLLEGDANNDNKVTLVDFSILATTFAKCVGGEGYDSRADFNEDTCVTLPDLSLLATNFGEEGQGEMRGAVGKGGAAVYAKAARAGSVVLAAVPCSTLPAVGETVDVDIEVQAGDHLVDGAAAYLAYDPTVLEIESVIAGDTLPVPILSRIDKAAGILEFAAGTFSDFPSGTFTLCTATFKVAAAAKSTEIAFTSAAPHMTEVTYNKASVLSEAKGATLRTAAQSQSPTIQGTPAAGIVGLGLMAAACALAGAITLRKK